MEEKYLDKDKTYPDKEASLSRKDIVSKDLSLKCMWDRSTIQETFSSHYSLTLWWKEAFSLKDLPSFRQVLFEKKLAPSSRCSVFEEQFLENMLLKKHVQEDGSSKE